jgi:hypothetical protein
MPTPRMFRTGSRESVWDGRAKQTRGGLKKSDLMKKNGKLVSIRASRAAKKMFSERMKNDARFREAFLANMKTKKKSKKSKK